MLRVISLGRSYKLTSIVFMTVLAGCSPSENREFKDGKAAVAAGNYRIALTHFNRVLARGPEEEIAILAAREAARITFYETKNYKESADFFKFLIIHSKDPAERQMAQKQIADIYFSQLNDYPRAVIEINKLIPMLADGAERAKYKMNLARAYYYQNNFSQAENEADEFLRTTTDEKLRFDLSMLKGNIALAKKDLPRAIEVYKEVLKNFPKLALQDNVSLTMAICYEELKDYKNAIATLELLRKTHPVPEYIDLRIKHLSERQKNAPGAHGARK